VKKFLYFFLLLITISCATEEEGPETNAHPAAYSMDNFTPHTPMPERKAKKLKFYFKECSVTESRTHYSNTSYFCEDLNGF
jgi:hypothetical protein